jgi:hypothetical protein
VILVFLCCKNCQCEIFSAIDELDELVKAEKLIIEEFKLFVKLINDSYLVE